VTNCGTTGELSFGIWGYQYYEFSQTNNCPSILDAGTSCTIEVVFSPRSPGPRGGGLDINDNDYALVVFVGTGHACSGFSLFCAPRGVVAVSVAIAPDPTGTFGRFAYATNANSNTVSMFGINANGTLSALVPAKVATGANPTSMAIDPSGKFAYVANAGSNDVSMYAVGADGILASLGSPMAAGTLPISVAIAPDSTGKLGKFVYVANDNSNNLSIFSINPDGTLTPAGTVGVGDSPVSVAVHPSGKFAYVLSNNSCQGGTCYENTSVYVFNINSTTGALTLAETKVAGTNGPTSMAVDPSGNFAAVANEDGLGIILYSINATTGALGGSGFTVPYSGNNHASLVFAIHPSGTLLAYVTNFPNDVSTHGYDIATGAFNLYGTVAAGSSPTSIAIDPSGKFAYVGNSGSLNVSMYRINADGTLTPLVPGTIGL